MNLICVICGFWDFFGNIRHMHKKEYCVGGIIDDIALISTLPTHVLLNLPLPQDLPSPPDATPTAGLATPPSRKSFEQLSSERAARIARLKEQKQLEKKLEVHTKHSHHVTKIQSTLMQLLQTVVFGPAAIRL